MRNGTPLEVYVHQHAFDHHGLRANARLTAEIVLAKSGEKKLGVPSCSAASATQEAEEEPPLWWQALLSKSMREQRLRWERMRSLALQFPILKTVPLVSSGIVPGQLPRGPDFLFAGT